MGSSPWCSRCLCNAREEKGDAVGFLSRGHAMLLVLQDRAPIAADRGDRDVIGTSIKEERARSVRHSDIGLRTSDTDTPFGRNMKVVILLCLAALVLADDVVYRPRGYGYRDTEHGGRYPPRPIPYPRPDDYYRPGSVRYHYNIDYPKYWARQGKQETIDQSGTRGSYFVDEPNSNVHVTYDFPSH